MKHRVEVEFEDFAWSRLAEEATRQRTTIERLLVHAALYFLSDLDRGRFSRRVPPAQEPPPDSEC